MDYEKKYKEALELARVAAFNGHQSLMEGIFPELKESEDERIRKWLIAQLEIKSGSNDADRENMILKAITWLEKQGEQEVNEPDWCHHKVDLSDCSEKYRKAYYDGWNNCNQQHSQCNAEQKSADKVEPKQEELTEFEKAVKQVMEEAIECGDTHNLKADADMLLRLTQKPWSEEDINKPNGGIVMEDFNDGNGFYKVNLAYLNEEQVEEIEELVKRWGLQPKEDEDESIVSDLLDYFDEDKCLKHEVNDIVKWLKTIKPQQKGWGENEIKMLDNLITYLDGRKDLLEEIKSTYISWLKSLKERIGG